MKYPIRRCFRTIMGQILTEPLPHIPQIQTPAAIFGDCMTVLPLLPDQSIDMILCDLPYHITRNEWDSPLPLEDYILVDDQRISFSELNQMLWAPGKRKLAGKTEALRNLFNMPMRDIVTFWETNKLPGLWSQYRRIIRLNGAIVLFGAGMFASELMRTGKDLWRYNLIWEKNHPTGFLNANRRPLRSHECILVFYRKLPVYHPQKTSGHERKVSTAYHKRNSKLSSNYGSYKPATYDSTERYPTSIWRFPSDKEHGALHPTQKPVALCEALIKTFTDDPYDEKESPRKVIVLDNCAGSFTTAVACDNLSRSWIAIEKNEEYFQAGIKRVNDNRMRLGIDDAGGITFFEPCQRVC